ncbi:hypothetical protein [Nonomuraea sp. NPDC049400]|uniref:hypothetical protein n=1 Tax=Nonomuraea sp. NPDC049400 TaxID=3364352 RepID=UPI0037A7D0ED
MMATIEQPPNNAPATSSTISRGDTRLPRLLLPAIALTVVIMPLSLFLLPM